ncbi:MAG: GNAT family N-acetyltransferase [Acidimicrobiales bacterium]
MITAGLDAPELFDQAIRRLRGAGAASPFLSTPGALSFLAVYESEVVGWCWGYHLVRPDATSMAYLHELEVDEGHRRRDIGRRLVNAFMVGAVGCGAERMFLSTAADNRPARSLYESLGGALVEQGPTVNYWFRLGPSD